MRIPAITVAATFLVLAALQTSAEARPAASKVIDRTLLCSTSPSGGIYEVEARAHAGVRESRSKWKTLPFAVVTSGSTGSAATQLDNSLAWITAGRPSSATAVEEHLFPTPVLANGTLALSREHCRTVATRIPLTSKGLRGGAASQLGESLDCESPRRVLIRVRATFQSPAALRERDRFLRTTVPIAEASLAMRTQAGKPLVYAEVVQSGRTRLFTAGSCMPG